MRRYSPLVRWLLEYACLEVRLRRSATRSGTQSTTYDVVCSYATPDGRDTIDLTGAQSAQVTLEPAALLDVALAPADYGARLSAALFDDPRAAQAFRRARDLAAGAGASLRVRLRLDEADAELHALCWETMTDPEGGQILSGNENMPFSRAIARADQHLIPRRPRATVRALAVVASARDLASYALPPIDLAGEVLRIRAALDNTPLTILARELGERPPTLANLHTALLDGPDILIFVCHGTAHPEGTVLWLEDDDGMVERVMGEELSLRLLALDRRPLLVVLTVCQSAGSATRGDNALGAIGTRLTIAGLPAVVAMQGPISVATAASFLPTFFRELLRNGRIDTALVAARALVMRQPDWWVPVLFMQMPDGRIWTDDLAEIARPDNPAPLPVVPTLLGREEELRILAERLARRGLVVLSGAPGVGKTALATILARGWLARDRVFWFAFDAGRGMSHLVRKLAEFLAWHGYDGIWKMLQAPRRNHDTPPKTQELIDRLLIQARDKNFLFFLDDLQYVDRDEGGDGAEAHADLSHLLRGLREAALGGQIAAIVTAWRTPDELMPQFDDPPLSGLSGDVIADLLAQRVAAERGVTLAPDVRERLAGALEGNALFINLAATALMGEADPGAWVEDLIERAALGSASIEISLAERVDQLLGEPEREVMRAIAVLDGNAARPLLEQLLGAELNLQASLRELYGLNLLSLRNRRDEVYGQHALLRAFYYKQATPDQRQSYHLRAGALFAGGSRPEPLLAARHLERGGDPAGAARVATGNFWGLVNGMQGRPLAHLLARFTGSQLEEELWMAVCIARGELETMLVQHEAAREAYAEALDLLTWQADTPATRARRARVLRGRAAALERLGDYSGAIMDCRTALEALGDQPDPNLERARVLTQLASALLRTNDYADALAACEAGLAALPPEPAGRRERVALLQRQATLHATTKRVAEAVPILERALRAARRLGDPLLTAAVLHNLGTCHYMLGQDEVAAPYYQESLDLKTAAGDETNRIITLNNLAALYLNRGEYEQALTQYTASAETCARLGLPRQQAQARLNLGVTAYRLGRLELAEAQLRHAREEYETLSSEDQVSSCLYRLGDVALARGDPAGALAAADEALIFADQAQSRANRACALRVRGQALCALDDLAGAAAALEEAVTLQEQVNSAGFDQALLLLAQAELARRCIDLDNAQARTAAALTLAQKLKDSYVIGLAAAQQRRNTD